jgi:uncharacterized membrane protein YsdA (DUF1294 family)/cold shock CspA family protein
MRHQGKITKWKDDQGFGFITPDGGGDQVFVHIKSFSNRLRRPLGNEIVTYEVISDEKGRRRAEHVAFMGDRPRIPGRDGAGWFVLSVIFLIFVAVSVVLDQLPIVVLALYVIASAVAFLVYAHDKSAAKKGQWRTNERTLHVLSLIGGWPGALIAQKLFRHKSKKPSFRILFWTTVVFNCIGLVWLFSNSGAEALRSFLGSGLAGR